jgi:L-ascorbate metabolism protein UlaG (beta-lactamase superfamily)
MNRRNFLMTSSAALMASATPTSQNIADAPSLKVQRLSWAGIKIELGDFTAFIDPFTSKEIWDGSWKMQITPLEVTTKSRAVMITHLHNDHFDQPALKELLKENGAVHCHAEIATTVASRGFRVRTTAKYQPLNIGELTVTPVPAMDGVGEDQVSWVVSGGGKRIFHGGDTLWHGGWYHIARQHGPFDVAFLPINGVTLHKRQSPESGIPATMTPEQAVAAAIVLDARKFIPIHYGVSDDGYTEYPDALNAAKREAARRGLFLEPAEPGAKVVL